MTADTTAAAEALPRFVGAEELRGWCATAEGRLVTQDLLASIRRTRATFVDKVEPDLQRWRDMVKREEAKAAEILSRLDRQIEAIEAALAAAGVAVA